ncbi:MAG: hypothetical protein RI932_2541 [Pseudomonadota bacterium]|jgi:hypothetical protein
MRALLFLPEFTKANINDLSVIIRSSGISLVECATEEEVFQHMNESQFSHRRNLLISDESHHDLVDKFSQQYPNCLIILTIRSPIGELPNNIRDCLPVQCFVASNNNEFEPRDMQTIIRKFQTSDIFGVEKYIKGSCEIFRHDILTHSDKNTAIERVGDFVRYLGGSIENNRFQEYSRRISDMLDELVLNAVFDANHRYKGQPHRTEFQLDNTDLVTVKWAFDGEQFGLSVTDRFGRLKKETILRYLDTTLDLGDVERRKSGGLGIKFVFERLHQFVVNVHSDLMTEVICLLRFERRLKDFDARPRSFHYFSI